MASPLELTPVEPRVTDNEGIERALEAVLESSEFEGAARLQSFLKYVVEEYLAGRGETISSKTIAEDVYGRKLDHGEDPLAIVRVDAGRLRRRLAAFYDRAGSEDHLRIHIDAGGYCPRFEKVSEPDEGTRTAAKNTPDSGAASRWFWLATGVAAGAVIFAFFSSVYAPAPFKTSVTPAASATTDAPGNADELREALFRLSPAKLQASNLAVDARDLMFPALDRSRLMTALSLFEHAIRLDPDHYGGHAGAAQIRAILALTTMDLAERTDLLASALASSDRAVALAPGEGWAHSAYAVTAYAGKDCETALSRSAQAQRLGPDDVYVSNFDALIALFCGENQHALETATKWVDDARSSKRLGFGNVIVAAHFNMGQYQSAVDGAFAAIRSGGPVSPLNVAYLTAAYVELGDHASAEESLALLNRAWPAYPLDAVVRSIYVDPVLPEKLVDAVMRAGWSNDASMCRAC